MFRKKLRSKALKSLEVNLPFPKADPNEPATAEAVRLRCFAGSVPLRGSGTKQAPQLFLCAEQMLGLWGDNLFQHRPGNSRCLSGSLALNNSWSDQQSEQISGYTTGNGNTKFSRGLLLMASVLLRHFTSPNSSEGTAAFHKAPHVPVHLQRTFLTLSLGLAAVTFIG